MSRAKRPTVGWFLHPDHGYMYRGPVRENGWQDVVTALCLNTREVEEDAKLWEAHKSRLRVNGGCGALAGEEIREGDHNPAFKAIAESEVPEHIKREFLALVEGP